MPASQARDKTFPLPANSHKLKQESASMKRSIWFRLTTAIAFASMLTGPSVAQPTATAPSSYPNWTGAPYPLAQHLTIMLLHFDDAAIAMGRAAQQNAKSESVKDLAAAVITERTRDIDATRSVYTKQYGQAPPAWPTPQNGYGPGMMGGYGPGMMGGGHGPGMMAGSYGQPGGTGNAGPRYGPMMMGYGDAYQMMMGGRANWWGSASADDSFVPALVRLDAMEISMATLGLTASDAATKRLAHNILSARTDELSRLAKGIKS